MVSTYASSSAIAATVDADVGHSACVRGGRARRLRPHRTQPGRHRPRRRGAPGPARQGRDRARRGPHARRPGHRVERSPPRWARRAAHRRTSGRPSPVHPAVAVVDAAVAEAADEAGLPGTLIREYLPLRQGDRTVLVVGLWRDALPMLTRLDDLRRDIVIVTLTAAIIAAGVLYLVFRSAQVRINRQTDALVAATRHDALTGTLNHGALVAHLAARDRGRPREPARRLPSRCSTSTTSACSTTRTVIGRGTTSSWWCRRPWPSACRRR